MKRIVVGVDGSDNARRALDMALTIASKFEAAVTLAYAVPPVPVVGEPTLVNLVEIQRQQEEYGKQLLAELEVAKKAGAVPVTTQLLLGPAAESLTDLAEREQADLVVIGSRGRNAVARVLLGSVSTRLIHVCKRPVLIVH